MNEVRYLIKNKLGFKSSKKRELRFARQALSEIFKAKFNNNIVNIEQGQLNFD